MLVDLNGKPLTKASDAVLGNVCQQIIEQAERHVSAAAGSPARLLLIGFAENGQGLMHINDKGPSLSLDFLIKLLEQSIQQLKMRKAHSVGAPLGFDGTKH